MTAPKPPLAHFFFHSWGKWEDDKRIGRFYSFDVDGNWLPEGKKRIVGEDQIQTRRCVTCNKLQTKAIPIW